MAAKTRAVNPKFKYSLGTLLSCSDESVAFIIRRSDGKDQTWLKVPGKEMTSIHCSTPKFPTKRETEIAQHFADGLLDLFRKEIW